MLPSFFFKTISFFLRYNLRKIHYHHLINLNLLHFFSPTPFFIAIIQYFFGNSITFVLMRILTFMNIDFIFFKSDSLKIIMLKFSF